MAEALGHTRHDPVQVAVALDRGARLAPMLERCGRCRALYRDLVALTAALPSGALPSRSRAFTLDADDARRLQPGIWRSWWAALVSARDSVTKPLAVGFTTLGLAGLLLTAGTELSMGMGAAAGPQSGAMGVDRADPSAVPAGQAPDTPASGAGGETMALTGVPDEPRTPAMLLVSAGLLVAGSSLFMARRIVARSRAVR